MNTIRLLLPIAGAALLADLASTQNWIQATPPSSPAAATFPRMAFDSQRGRCVAFGGWNAPSGTIVFADTWEYDGANWSLQAPATVPDERDSHAMAYDTARGRTVMFGGWDFNFVLLGQTWEWDGTNWVDRTPANAPSARILPAMAYDLARGVTVLFGGDDAVGLTNDTWEWDGTNWTQRTTTSAPSARSNHAMAYDLARGRVVLFGGATTTSFLGDTWEFDGTTWSAIVTDGGPGARVDHQMVYDLQRGRIVLFGGSTTTADLNDTWEWNGTSWRELHTANRPTTNTAMAMAYDSVRNQTVVFGGFNAGAAVGATWELGGSGGTYRTFGSGCVGGNNLTPRLVPVVMPSLGATTQLDVAGLPTAGGIVYLAAGVSDAQWGPAPLPIDLGVIGLTGCRGYTSNDAGAVLTHTNGTATWTLAIPANPALAGVSIFLQALSFDAAAPRPFDGAMSNAAQLTVN
jgi:hypothetical protein